MKKAIKGLIVASAVAAVVGVGAVSYAAWSGGENTTKNVTGNTAVINTIGDIVVTPDSASGSVNAETKAITMNNLCPVDQTEATKPSGSVNYWKFTLSSATTGTQTVKYTILGSISAGSDGGATPLGTTAKLYWSESEPTSATTAAPGGTQIDASAADITGSTVYVYIVADNTDGMNATISVTFGVAAGA
ncbi:MAG: hypothetical protein K2J01_04680 [Clostridiales bacterium]|nr:hypothetical protein [Clostridiales bacterium]